MDSPVEEGGEKDLEMGLSDPDPAAVAKAAPPPPSPSPSTSSPMASSSSRPALVVSSSFKTLSTSSSSKSLVVSHSGKSLVLSNSGKRMDQAGKKKYVRQVTGRFNDTELHLAAQRGDVLAVREIISEIDAQMLQTQSGADFDAGILEIRTAVVNEVNERGETALFTAAEKGHIEVVRALLPYMTQEGITAKNQSGFDPLHIAANQGHEAIVKVLLDHDPALSKTFAQSNATPLISAAMRGHVAVVKELLSKDSSLIKMSKSNGKNALHFAARQGHVEIVKALIEEDPQLARRTDKKGQTALHMAVKGVSCEVVKMLLQGDAFLVILPDKFDNMALHVATRKKRVEIVNELLRSANTIINALTRDHKTALDIADELPFSEETSEIKDCLKCYGALKANELNQPKDELRKTVTEIRKNVYTQIEQTRKTNLNMDGIAHELRKLHRIGIYNATNSVTVVASLIATITFASIFTIPGGDNDDGMAVTVSGLAFKTYFLFNAIALFTSLAVVLVQITVVRGEIKSERRVGGVINKLMWLASVCTTGAFIASSYIVVGRRNKWAAILVTVIGGVIMMVLLATMTYYVLKFKRKRKVKKADKLLKATANSAEDMSDPEVNIGYAI